MNMDAMLHAIRSVTAIKGWQANAFAALEIAFLYTVPPNELYDLSKKDAFHLQSAFDITLQDQPEYFTTVFEQESMLFGGHVNLGYEFIKRRTFGLPYSLRLTDMVPQLHELQYMLVDKMPLLQWPHIGMRNYTMPSLADMSFISPSMRYDPELHASWECFGHKALPLFCRHLPKGEGTVFVGVCRTDEGKGWYNLCDTVVLHRYSPLHTLCGLYMLQQRRWYLPMLTRALDDPDYRVSYDCGDVRMEATFPGPTIFNFDVPIKPEDFPLAVSKQTGQPFIPANQKTIFSRMGMLTDRMPNGSPIPGVQFINLFRPIQSDAPLAPYNSWDFI